MGQQIRPDPIVNYVTFYSLKNFTLPVFLKNNLDTFQEKFLRKKKLFFFNWNLKISPTKQKNLSVKLKKRYFRVSPPLFFSGV